LGKNQVDGTLQVTMMLVKYKAMRQVAQFSGIKNI
jgi:hypothetical protein